MNGNGLRTFDFHAEDEASGRALTAGFSEYDPRFRAYSRRARPANPTLTIAALTLRTATAIDDLMEWGA